MCSFTKQIFCAKYMWRRHNFITKIFHKWMLQDIITSDVLVHNILLWIYLMTVKFLFVSRVTILANIFGHFDKFHWCIGMTTTEILSAAPTVWLCLIGTSISTIFAFTCPSIGLASSKTSQTLFSMITTLRLSSKFKFMLSGLSRNNLIITSSPPSLIPKEINSLSSPRAGPFTT